MKTLSIVALLFCTVLFADPSQRYLSDIKLNEVTKYAKTKTLTVPEGYVVLDAPSLSANIELNFIGSNSYNTAGFIKREGKIFYISDWSYEQWTKNPEFSPYWILPKNNWRAEPWAKRVTEYSEPKSIQLEYFRIRDSTASHANILKYLSTDAPITIMAEVQISENQSIYMSEWSFMKWITEQSPNWMERIDRTVYASNAPEAQAHRDVVLIVGHNQQDQGAQRTHNNKTYTEWSLNRSLADKVKDNLKTMNTSSAIVFRDGSSKDLQFEIAEAYQAAETYSPKVIIELHANYYKVSSASGSEMLFGGNTSSQKNQSRALAKSVQDNVIEHIRANGHPIKDRKVKQRYTAAYRQQKINGASSNKQKEEYRIKYSSRGGISLHATKIPTIIAEPYFLSNYPEFSFMISNQDTLAYAIAKGATEHLKK